MLPAGVELEVCVDRVDSAIAAVSAGATRIEFNQALQLGGLTPALASCQWLVQCCERPVVAMLRPHAYDFCYTAREQSCLLRDCELLLNAGVAGIACGALNPSGDLDLQLIARLVQLCDKQDVVLHRAFDQLKNPLQDLPRLIDLGVRRILTSGGGATAEAGAEQLLRLNELSAGAVDIIAAGGIHADNLPGLIRATGCRQFHGSFTLGGSAADLNHIRRARGILEGEFSA